MKYVMFLLLSAAVCIGHAADLRIVSLAASITQNLYLIGANHEIVGCTRFCITQPEDDIAVVADAVNVNLEKIVALKPDVVVAGGLTSPKILDSLNRMGIKTTSLPQPQNFEEICRQCLTLGEISGQTEEAEAVVNRAKARMTEVQKRIDRTKAPSVFMEIGRNPLYAAIPGSFMHDYIVQAGGRNIAEKLDNASTSKEFVLLQNPDVIFVVGMGIVGEEEIQTWKAIRSLNATRKGKVFPLDQYICSPTPETFVETVDTIISYLYQP